MVQPKFYKIIVCQHQCIRLRIPEDFASRYCKNMLDPVYLEVPDGDVWEVEVEHSQGQIWLAKGWQDFCDYYSISCGHFLMLGYNARSHFNVTIFDLSAAEIEYPYSSARSIRTFHCHDTHRAPKREQSESDDPVVILEGIPRSQKSKEKIPDMVEHSVENLGHVPLGQSSKRKRHEGDVEDDVSVDMHIKNCRIDKEQSKSVYDQNKTVTDKESSIAYQKAKAFKSKNPFIISFMQPSYVFAPFNLSISLKFARKYFLENDGNLVLRVPGSGSWSVKCTLGTNDAKVGAGWKAFVLENKLKVGDVCVFEVIKGTQLFVDVTIFRADGSTLMHSTVGEVPGGCKVEKSQEDAASPSFTRKKKKIGGSCRMHKQQSKIVYDKKKTVRDKESSIAYQRAQAFKSKNPFIILFMQPSYISIPYILKISSTFARKYLLKNCGNVVLRVPGRGSWSIRCTSRTANTKVCSGWKAFVLDNKLKLGDVCVFEVIEGTQLFVDVTIYRADGSTPMHKIAGEKPEEHVEHTEIEHSVETLSHCPLGHGCKRKRLEGKEAEDDVSFDIHTKSIKVEKSKEDVASPSFTRKTKKSGESCRMHKQQSEIVYSKNMTVLYKERTIAYQKAKAFKSKNPFVIYFMQPSYVSKPYNLHMFFLSAWTNFREKCGDLVLRVPGRGSWSVKHGLGTSYPQIRFSWKAFVLDNKLKVGDVCVFELIKGPQPFLDVTIFRAAESKPMHKIDRGVSACKNKIIKTKNSAPCSQPKIVHSRKLNLEKKQKGDCNGFITSKTKEEHSEGTAKHVQQSSSCMGTVVAKEMIMAYQKAKAFTSKNPFFISFMQPSYVSLARRPLQLTITLSVARKFFSTRHSDAVLQISSKKSEWTVKCTLGTSNAKFSGGWKEFVLDNNLKVGDVCVFELVSRSKPLFNVIIFPSGEGM